MKDIKYYKSKYTNKLGEIHKELKDICVVEDIDYEITLAFDKTANTEEVVGYYLVNEGENALKNWLRNIEGIKLTEQDKEVTKILKDLLRK